MRLIECKSDFQIALDILVHAYSGAANLTWVMPKGKKQHLRVFFNYLLIDAVNKKGAYLTSNHSGVLLLYDMQNKNRGLGNFFRKIHIILFITGIKKGRQLLKWQRTMKKIRPKTGLYGMALAILDNSSRQKTGMEIKNEAMKIARENQLPIYAETTDPRILKLYQTIHFKTYHTMKHPFTNLNTWFLKTNF